MVEAFRAAYRSSEIGRHYSGWAHLAFTTIGSLSAIIFAISQLRDVSWERARVPLFFLFANLGEYFGHKNPMHRPMGPLRILYQRHTLQHHQFFTHETMAAESSRDFKMV